MTREEEREVILNWCKDVRTYLGGNPKVPPKKESTIRKMNEATRSRELRERIGYRKILGIDIID